jgi:hypothetical protein
MKYTAWDSDDTDADEAREYTDSSPREVAAQHAEWLYRQGDPQEEYSIRVRALGDGNSQEWDVHVNVERDVWFNAALATPVEHP